MTNKELVAAAKAELLRTTSSGVRWVKDGRPQGQWSKGFALLDQIVDVPTTPPPIPVPPVPPVIEIPPPEPVAPTTPKFTIRCVYDIGWKTGTNVEIPFCCTDFAEPRTALGIESVINVICSPKAVSALSAKGLKSAGWYLGGWNNSLKKFSATEAQVTTWVNAVKNTAPGSSHMYTVCDEPTYSPEFIAALKIRLATIRAADPLAICQFADYTWSGRMQLSKWGAETDIDMLFLDTYAVNGTSYGAPLGQPGIYVADTIPFQIAEAQKAKAARVARVGARPLRFVGVIGMGNDQHATVPSGDPGYTGNAARIPSLSPNNQIQLQVDAWRAAPAGLIEGIGAFSYGLYPEPVNNVPPMDWRGFMRNRADLCNEMAKQFLRS